MIDREEAEALAHRLRLRFYRTSVKDNLNVDEGMIITVKPYIYPSRKKLRYPRILDFEFKIRKATVVDS